jgi:hypothetical protein
VLEDIDINDDIITRMEEREEQNRILIKSLMEAQDQS